MESTETPKEQEPSIGQRLFANGWRQGVLFQAPAVQFAFTSVDAASSSGHKLQTRYVSAKERLILISQDCDISAKSDNAEPYVEAMICGIVDAKHAAKVERNSARAFVIDPRTCLTAQARYRLSIAKPTLLGLSFEPWPSDAQRLDRFIRWLARRYDRPALPDEMVIKFQNPIEEALNRLDQEAPDISAAFSRAIHEIRVNLPETEQPPFDLQLTFLLKEHDLTDAELDALVAVEGIIRDEIDRAVVTLDETRFLTPEQISMAEYFGTRPLFLEYHTYKGDEVAGAEPYPRA